MRLLVVTQYFWPENFRINDLVHEMANRGHSVTVLTGYPNYPDGQVFSDFKSAPGRFSSYMGAEIVRVPLVPRGKRALSLLFNYISFMLLGTMLGAWKLRGKKFDKIFVFEPSPITVGIPAIFLRWIKKAPLAFWVLDLWPESLRAVGVVKSERLLNAVGYLVSFIYRRCDAILVQSRSFVKNVTRYCSNVEKIHYFPSWAEDGFEGASISSGSELNPFFSSFKLVFAGNIGEAQDFPAILEAATILKDRPEIQWILIGDGRARVWVSDQVAQRGLSKSVHLLGRFDLERMPAFFADADALLVTLKRSDVFSMTIPGKVQSYLAAGRPILGMLDGEGAEVILEAKAGFVCQSGNARGLADNVLRMASTSVVQRDEMGAAGRRHYLKNFERTALMNELEQLLFNLRLEGR